ncbi:WXG100 family type VII secretion target [Actinoplanes sp. G11-F43]|uniref:WXG100 family type VII secretion target n=1 Tax=Actinoplanes sp. G11-F43 TaxID=3424130 RepID=UPI003D32B6CA
MAETRASSEAMAGAASKFDQVNSDLQKMLTDLMNELSTLNSTWKGLGAVAFENVKQGYAADLRTLNDALAQTSEAIRTSGTSYSSADSEAASRVAKSGGTLSLPL